MEDGAGMMASSYHKILEFITAIIVGSHFALAIFCLLYHTIFKFVATYVGKKHMPHRLVKPN